MSNVATDKMLCVFARSNCYSTYSIDFIAKAIIDPTQPMMLRKRKNNAEKKEETSPDVGGVTPKDIEVAKKQPKIATTAASKEVVKKQPKTSVAVSKLPPSNPPPLPPVSTVSNVRPLDFDKQIRKRKNVDSNPPNYSLVSREKKEDSTADNNDGSKSRGEEVNKQQSKANKPTVSKPPPPPIPPELPPMATAISISSDNVKFSQKSSAQRAWDDKIQELKAYKAIQGHVNVPKTEELKALGRFVNNQRQYYRKRMNGEATSLTDERIRCLEDVSF